MSGQRPLPAEIDSQEPTGLRMVRMSRKWSRTSLVLLVVGLAAPPLAIIFGALLERSTPNIAIGCVYSVVAAGIWMFPIAIAGSFISSIVGLAKGVSGRNKINRSENQKPSLILQYIAFYICGLIPMLLVLGYFFRDFVFGVIPFKLGYFFL